MPSFNPQTLNYSVRNGNAVAILVGDQLIGFGQTTSHSIDFGTDQLYGVGNAKPQENQQLKFTLEITLSSLQLTDVGEQRFGYSASWVSILANTELDFHLVDNNGNVIVTYVASTARNYSSNIPANQPITEDTSFVALDVLGPDGVSLLAGNDATALATAAAALATNFVSGG